MRFVEKIFPFNSEIVETDISLDVRFFVDVDADTLTNSTVILFDLNEQKTVETKLNYNRRRLLITPLEKLQPNTQYELMLKNGPKGIKDILGLEMIEVYKSSFKTNGKESLKIPAIIYPINRTIIDAPFKIKIDGSKENVYVQLQIAETNRFDVILWPPNEQLLPLTNEPLEITPDFNWSERNYYIRLRVTDGESRKSEFSNPVQVFVIPKVVEPPIEEVPIDPMPIPPEEEPTPPEVEPTPPEVEPTPPEVELPKEDAPLEQVLNRIVKNQNEENVIPIPFEIINSNIKDGELNVSLDRLGRIIIRFSENLDASTVNNKSIYVVKEKN